MTELAGYRILRRLGAGGGAEVLLGFAGDAQVVLKVRPAADPAGLREAVALDRAAGEHVVPLLDLHVDDERVCLVLERLHGIALDELLDRRSTFDAGEVVTILAPLALAVDRLHATGVAHGRLSATAVRFTGHGAPMLVGFGSAELFPPGSPEVVLERHPGVVADRAALSALAGSLLRRVSGAQSRAAAALAAALDGEAAPRPSELAERLFRVADGAAVRFAADDAGSPRVPVAAAAAIDESHVDRSGVAGRLVAAVSPLVPAELRRRASEIASPALRLLERLPVRSRRLAVGGVAGIVAVVIAGVMWPAAGAPSPAPSGSSSADATVSVEEESRPPDDPVAAAVVLLETRERCLRDRSLLCLDAVDQSGSPAATRDRQLLATVEAGGELPVVAVTGDPRLVERLGDSALVEFPPGSEPASLLLIETENGWRIRDELPAPPAVP